MARTRALLTDRERELIASETADENKRYQAISRVRSRIRDELAEDIAVLANHHPQLYEEFREIACRDSDPSDSGRDR